jgi:acyl carrier protein
LNTVIESQIRSLVAATLRVDEAMIRPEATLADDLGADSLDLVSLILAIEDQFQVDIHDEEAAEILTVEQLTEYVTLALAEAGTGYATASMKQLTDSRPVKGLGSGTKPFAMHPECRELRR